jgi:pyruvate dehydrogenase E1 component alpha subunit
MAQSIAFRGEVPFVQILDEEGRLDPSACGSCPSVGEMIAMYEAMILTRSFDARAFLLQREGRLGTYAQSLGQEGAQVGSAFALTPADWVVPSYRENGVLICRGVPMQNILLYWGGDERGTIGLKARRCLPYTVPVGTQVPHAVGIALACKLRRESAVVACYMGDGATSTGDFHEGLTMAGVLRTPVVFFCQNNQWAISVPRRRQCAALTLAQKALGYGLAGVQVDGNDVLACHATTREAVERARQGGGATLIEAVTYRMADHTTADDASRYREAAEVEAWKRRDPIERLRRYLVEVGSWDETREEHLVEMCRQKVEAATLAAEQITPPDPADIGRFLYANPPAVRPLVAAPVDAAAQTEAGTQQAQDHRDARGAVWAK